MISLLYCKDHLLGKLFHSSKFLFNFCSMSWTLLHFSDVCIWSEQFVWAVRGEWRLLWCWLSQQGYRHRTSKLTSSENEKKGKSEPDIHPIKVSILGLGTPVQKNRDKRQQKDLFETELWNIIWIWLILKGCSVTLIRIYKIETHLNHSCCFLFACN